MRILHVVSLTTPDNAYGGPVTVALNQTRELAARGHSVTLVSGDFVDETTESVVDGVRHLRFPTRRTLPGGRFSTLVAPRLHLWLLRHASGFDAVHVHVGREVISLGAAALVAAGRRPLFLQPHGMLAPKDSPAARLLDALVTWPVLRRARMVFRLNDVEHRQLAPHARPDSLRELTNGITVPREVAQPGSSETVIFVARLHPRKRPVLLLEALSRALAEDDGPRLVFVGPDEGEGDRLRTLVARHPRCDRVELVGALPPEGIPARLRASALYVLPSVDEPYPMSVLEAMSVGLPVVVCDSNGLADMIRSHAAGTVVPDHDLESLESAVMTLMGDAVGRQAMGARGRAAVEAEFALAPVVDVLETSYFDGRQLT